VVSLTAWTEAPWAPEIAALVALVLAALAETLHAARVRRLARLAFGPRGRPAAWAHAAPFLRSSAFAALAWGLATLVAIEPRRYTGGTGGGADAKPGHVMLVLDVSPSMRLVDSGPERADSRMSRARRLMESFFSRAPLDSNLVTVVAVYHGAKPVVVDTRDAEVVRNILGDLPMHYAFRSGKTRLLDGLEVAAEIAHPWEPRSTTLILISDGDTVPMTGMPAMPPSIRSVMVVGVGDPTVGRFIDGRQSRQDVPTLKQIAARLGGEYHDGNEKHLSSSWIASATGREPADLLRRLTRREYALIAVASGAALLALLPLFLHFLGTSWRPGPSKRGPPGPFPDPRTVRREPGSPAAARGASIVGVSAARTIGPPSSIP
jgi:Ca-activated chloride channel family protein